MEEKREEQIKYFVKAELEAEMSWLRCIEMNNEKDVKRAALELILSRPKSATRLAMRELFGWGE